MAPLPLRRKGLWNWCLCCWVPQMRNKYAGVAFIQKLQQLMGLANRVWSQIVFRAWVGEMKRDSKNKKSLFVCVVSTEGCQFWAVCFQNLCVSSNEVVLEVQYLKSKHPKWNCVVVCSNSGRREIHLKLY